MIDMSADEKLMYQTKPHWVVFTPGLLVEAVCISAAAYGFLKTQEPLWFLLILPGALLGIMGVLHYATAQFVLTTKRVVMKQGVLQRRTVDINVHHIEGTSVEQGVGGQLFNYGSLTLIGTGGTREAFAYIQQPERFRRLIQEQRRTV